MTAKRFTMKGSTILENGEEITAWDCYDLLNQLHEENQDLKAFNQDLSEELSVCANARISKDNLIEKLTEENEQLKQNIADWETSFDLLKYKNEQLKKQVNDLVTGIQETSKMSADAITKQWSEDKYL